MDKLERLAREVDAYTTADRTPFQRRARILQSLWRIEQGYPEGEHRGISLGSRLPMPWAEETLANFLTDEIRGVVRREVLDPERSRGKLYGKPRLFDNLLSSQPLAFNIFGPLSCDLGLATDVFRQQGGERCREVTDVRFEWSPGRGDPRYTGDSSAFDVYVTFKSREGGRGFAGIEVKYHEDLSGRPSTHKARYDEVAEAVGCFAAGAADRLRTAPLQQVWRDHLLAGSHLLADGFADGFFVFLSPAGNSACNEAIGAYRQCLTDDRTFVHWTLESVVEAVERSTDADWVGLLQDRYLDFAKVDAYMDRREP